jgi:hypothetical protein
MNDAKAVLPRELVGQYPRAVRRIVVHDDEFQPKSMRRASGEQRLGELLNPTTIVRSGVSSTAGDSAFTQVL